MPQATQTPIITELEDLVLDGFFPPSEGLTMRIAERIESLEAEAIRGIMIREESDLQEAHSNNDFAVRGMTSINSSGSNAEVLIQQRLLAEEIDSCLADSSESAEATGGQKLTIQKVITEGMADALGLEESDDLLKELSREFQTWIDPLGSFTAGWGEIISTKDGGIYLVAFPEAEDDALDPDLVFTRSFRSESATRSASTFFGRVAAKLGVG